jgi:hypothetical protein
MILKGNEITVHRNETFTIDLLVTNRDGSPFMVSSEYANPYILITVFSTKYSQRNRYLANWWLNLDEMYDENDEKIKIPRFKNTVVKTIENKNDLTIDDDKPCEYLYYNKEDGTYLYSTEDAEGTVKLNTYSFRIVHHFPNYITRNWVEQSYAYSIYLVSGTSTLNYLRSLYLEYVGSEPNESLTSKELYDAIYKIKPSVLDGVNVSRPLANYDVVQGILDATKLNVLSDPHGDITNKINETNFII